MSISRYLAAMATGPQFVEALAPVCGIHPATLDRYLRELRSAGIIPLSGKGGGKSASHFDHNHATSILLSLAAASPAGAADAVRHLGSLDWEQPEAGDISGLWMHLAYAITQKVARILSGQKVSGAEWNNWEMTLCLDPLMAWTCWLVHGTEVKRKYRARNFDNNKIEPCASEHGYYRGIRRYTVITEEVVKVAAELCADSMQHETNKSLVTP